MIKRKRLKDKHQKEDLSGLNENIKFSELRVIYPDQKINRVMTKASALSAAKEHSLDLVLVSDSSSSPVAKIMDYGKYKFEKNKKKKPQPKTTTKEIKMGPNIGEHDLQTKMRHFRKFIEGGNKVKVIVTFKGRGVTYKETGFDLIEQILVHVNDIATQEGSAKSEGRNIVTTFSRIAS